MGANAGPQPCWIAAATMLMHTRGIVVMTPDGGPNGQAQYSARDLAEACRTLLRYHEHAYVAPGERFPRPAPTRDPRDRDVCDIHDIRDVHDLSEIRRVMAAVVDQDHEPLERWYGMRDAEVAVVWDAHLGGQPVCLLGFESKPLPHPGRAPAHGPDPISPPAAKKVARAIHAASGNRPLVILADLSGCNDSPERPWQLEHGAEIGRAVVSFQGPIVLCFVAPFQGDASLIFSTALQDDLEVAALAGTNAPAGSVHHVVAPARLRPYLVDAVERGMAKEKLG